MACLSNTLIKKNDSLSTESLLHNILKELCQYIMLKIDGGHFDGLGFLCTQNVHISILLI